MDRTLDAILHALEQPIAVKDVLWYLFIILLVVIVVGVKRGGRRGRRS